MICSSVQTIPMSEQGRESGLAVPEKRWRKYQVTQMRNGMWRAECYQDDCGWFRDMVTEDGAEALVTEHASNHGLSFRRARAHPIE